MEGLHKPDSAITLLYRKHITFEIYIKFKSKGNVKWGIANVCICLVVVEGLFTTGLPCLVYLWLLLRQLFELFLQESLLKQK